MKWHIEKAQEETTFTPPQSKVEAANEEDNFHGRKHPKMQMLFILEKRTRE